MSEAQTLYWTFLNELRAQNQAWDAKPEQLVSGQTILEISPEQTIAFVRQAVREKPVYFYPLIMLLSRLVKRTLPYTREDIQDLLRHMAQIQNFVSLPMQALLRSLTHSLLDPETLNACRPELELLREQTYLSYSSAEQRKLIKLLDDILNGQVEAALPILGDEWSEPLLASLDEMEEETRNSWLALLRHCATASGTEPKNKWRAPVPTLIENLGQETFCTLATQWIGALAKNKGGRLREENTIVLKGLAWCCSNLTHAPLASALADAVIEGYQKLPGIGPRAPMVAGACLYALKTMPYLSCIPQIGRLRMNVRQLSYLKLIDQALNDLAERTGMSRDDLEELTIPTFDLVDGRFQQTFGSERAELTLKKRGVQIQWFDASGKSRKSESSTIKKDYKNEVEELKELCANISHMLTAQHDRLERLPLSNRTWPFPIWRERYLEHPLVGYLANRLLWHFSFEGNIKDAIWFEGRFVDANDQQITIPETALVSPWHPVLSSATEIQAWRAWLDLHQVLQPFTQAYREIYLLTDAERSTCTYSNRFAAHILQHLQFYDLAIARGWQNTLRLMVDDFYQPATFTLPHWKLRAEFWIEGAGNNHRTDTNGASTYLRLATDQVRFYPLEAVPNLMPGRGGPYTPDTHNNPTAITEPLPLEAIPAQVFSEIMRDVDLFVSMTNIGNDPTWLDRNHPKHYQDYWQSHSFGDLSAIAKTRKLLLERLIPRLTIADRCTFEECFLTVRGELHTYKIHLGSGNTLMEPDDEYLCIVPGHKTPDQTGKLFLPFEGDDIFSIILSKALLLAEDTKITDLKITRQIQF